MKKGYNLIMKYLKFNCLKITLITLGICMFGGIVEAQILSDNFDTSNTSSIKFKNLRIEKGTNLKQALNLLEQQFGVVFLYRTDAIQNRKVTSSKILSDNVEKALKELFKGQGLAYKYINPKTYAIYVIARKEKTKPKEQVLIDQFNVKGEVTDATTEDPLPGVNVVVKGTTIGAATGPNGKYSLDVPSANDTLVYSYIGYKNQVIPIKGRHTINVRLVQKTISGQQVVVVGYGTQKKSSVVAAITQVSGQDLQTTGDVPDVGMALTGKVPGVITENSTGLPGDENPQIFIRGMSTWHNAQPLVLVDGVERPLTSVDMSSVKSLTVLKDASATAVYGVRGANGVILITTKTGRQGSAQITGSFNTTVKVPSKLPDVMDSYNTLALRNQAIVYELGLSPASWSYYLPPETLNKYRNPANPAEAARYPNVNWDNALFKNYASSYHANLNVRGGSKFVTYFANADFRNEGDLFRKYNNSRGYQSGFGYNRLNVRSNLNFNITPTTKLKTKLAGSYGVRQRPWGFQGSNYGYWIAAYSTPPDHYLPIYPNGNYGYYPAATGGSGNSIETLAVSGVEYNTTTQLTTTFELDQDLSMLAKGLNFRGDVAFDNTFLEASRGINDLYNAPQEQYIDPFTGQISYTHSFDSASRFDYAPGKLWTTSGGSVDANATYRKVYYQLQLNYDFDLGKNNHFTEMGLFNRTQNATGSIIPHRRENWVFRTTYNYNDKYMIEYNGSYNGSEKFNAAHRFAFFSSGGVGWNISNENFMKSLTFVNNLKLRGSYGKIGDDNTTARWLYMTQWAYGGQAPLGLTGEEATNSPYNWYYITSVGNPNVHWATVTKADVGLDFGFFRNQITGSFDYFKDKRTDILIESANRAIPSYYGQNAPPANLGAVQNKGFELSVNLNHTFNKVYLWSKIDVTHAKNKVLYADDPALLPQYQMKEGKAIGQAYSPVSKGYYDTWGQLYASTPFNTNDNQKLPGGKQIVDYNADGIIDTQDNIPYGFSGTPQNTYSTSVGFQWKGFSGYVQFYGVNNVTRQVVLSSLGGNDLAFAVKGGYWSLNNLNASTQMPRWKSQINGSSSGSRFMYDGSYLRLKNAQIAYTFGPNSRLIEELGVRSIKIYVNGNNLFLWTQMPDDREANYAGTGWASQGAYPTVRRFNFGVNVNF